MLARRRTKIRLRLPGSSQFLQPDGTWGRYRTAAKFSSMHAALRFAEAHQAGSVTTSHPPWAKR